MRCVKSSFCHVLKPKSTIFLPHDKEIYRYRKSHSFQKSKASKMDA